MWPADNLANQKDQVIPFHSDEPCLDLRAPHDTVGEPLTKRQRLDIVQSVDAPVLSFDTIGQVSFHPSTTALQPSTEQHFSATNFCDQAEEATKDQYHSDGSRSSDYCFAYSKKSQIEDFFRSELLEPFKKSPGWNLFGNQCACLRAFCSASGATIFLDLGDQVPNQNFIEGVVEEVGPNGWKTGTSYQLIMFINKEKVEPLIRKLF